jgi:phosphate:Na+ symporter
MYLDPAAVKVPMIALGAATREALRKADALEAMQRGLRQALQRPGRRQFGELKRLDDVLDMPNTAIKADVTGLPSEAMIESNHHRVFCAVPQIWTCMGRGRPSLLGSSPSKSSAVLCSPA